MESVEKPKWHFLLTMDCERVQNKNSYPAGPLSWQESEENIVAFSKISLKFGYQATFFAVPEAAEKHASIFKEFMSSGHEVGLHLHPQTFRQGVNENLGNLPYETQYRIINDARDAFKNAMGFFPASFRSGYFSANRDTFRALAALGFKRGSCVVPGRHLPGSGGNWKGWSGQCKYIDSYFEVPVTTVSGKKISSRFFYLQGVKDLVNNGFFLAAVKKSLIPVYRMIRFANPRGSLQGKNEKEDFVLDLKIENGENLVLPHIIIPQLNMGKNGLDFQVLTAVTHNYINYTDAHYGRHESGMSRKKCLVQMLAYLNDRKDISVKSMTLSELQNEFDQESVK